MLAPTHGVHPEFQHPATIFCARPHWQGARPGGRVLPPPSLHLPPKMPSFSEGPVAPTFPPCRAMNKRIVKGSTKPKYLHVHRRSSFGLTYRAGPSGTGSQRPRQSCNLQFFHVSPVRVSGREPPSPPKTGRLGLTETRTTRFIK